MIFKVYRPMDGILCRLCPAGIDSLAARMAIMRTKQ